MSEQKKCCPHVRGARHAHAGQTHARGAAAARPPHAARPEPAARPNPAARHAANAPVQPKRQPAAPPVYRPEPKAVAQLKAAAGAHARPPRATPQMKPAPASAGPRPAAVQPAAPPPARPSSVLQPMKRKREDDDLEKHYGPTYWPPKTTLIKTPPSPTYMYYKRASGNLMDRGEMEASFEYMDFYSKHSGKSVGMTTGSGEAGTSTSLTSTSRSNTARPPPGRSGRLFTRGSWIAAPTRACSGLRCEELCKSRLFAVKKTKQEYNTSKRPPMCHIVAYNHIKWAVEWLYLNKSVKVGGTYKGPNVAGLDDDTWRKLVWHKSNLQPGHAKCNSKTASQAKGSPSTSKAKPAIACVTGRLKKLQPTWF